MTLAAPPYYSRRQNNDEVTSQCFPVS